MSFLNNDIHIWIPTWFNCNFTIKFFVYAFLKFCLKLPFSLLKKAFLYNLYLNFCRACWDWKIIFITRKAGFNRNIKGYWYTRFTSNNHYLPAHTDTFSNGYWVPTEKAVLIYCLFFDTNLMLNIHCGFLNCEKF